MNNSLTQTYSDRTVSSSLGKGFGNNILDISDIEYTSQYDLQVRKTPWLTIGRSVLCDTLYNLQQLSQMYSFNHSGEVKVFLDSKAFLMRFLMEFQKEIKKEFPQDDLLLEVKLCPDDLSYKQLLIVVKTKSEVKISIKKREKLNQVLNELMKAELSCGEFSVSVNIRYIK